MRLNADFDRRVVVRPEDRVWRSSPMPNVERAMLDRIGDEVARATSIVRYAPGSNFSPHVHGGGEEFLVLEGSFHDENGDYPVGSYVRNPIGTSHAPWAGPQGTTIFVKLHQFAKADAVQMHVDTKGAEWFPGSVDGLAVMPLHQHAAERVALVKWAPNTLFHRHQHWGGEEILVLDGGFNDEYGAYSPGSWLRNPHLSAHTPFTGEEGALIYVKTGHLPLAAQR